MKKIITNLWYDTDALAAAEFYCSLFDDSEIISTSYFGEAGPREAGMVLEVHFRLADQEFVALNGGPGYTYTHAMSLYVNCDDQAEIDRLWEGLLADGGSEIECGWLKDRWGVHWQIIPTVLPELISAPDRDAANRAMKAMLGMKKIDIAALHSAYDGK
ncbi:VOC family protein [Haloglycomyces albus]|uniref:VOC family protein n=1 Tax=Haloglycomyces albus TaxID=526067 RepID=UPI00046D7626|nr:VOC family protein [Haloglycomyces albus]